MEFEYQKGEEICKPVAMIYASHLVICGDNNEAIYLCSNKAALSTAFVHSMETFDSLLEEKDHIKNVFYKGDSITITF